MEAMGWPLLTGGGWGWAGFAWKQQGASQVKNKWAPLNPKPIG